MKYIFGIFIFLSFAFNLVYIANAQDSGLIVYTEAFNEYRNQYNEYLASHDQYILSRKQYDQYKTLASKERLQNDTVSMLVNREEVMMAYYKVISIKLDDSSLEMSDQRRAEYRGYMASEIEWMNSHKSGYSVSDSLAVLSDESELANIRVGDFLEKVYKSLYFIHRGKLDRYNSRNGVLYADLFTLTEKIKNEQREEYKLSDIKIDVINRWFGEIDLKYGQYAALLTEADAVMEKATGRGSAGVYKNSIPTLVKALSNLLERVRNAREIATEIKISEI